jgi:hypothetical protein
MSIKAQCPSCHKTFSVKDQFVGKRIKCPACAEPFECGAAGTLKSLWRTPTPWVVGAACACAVLVAVVVFTRSKVTQANFERVQNGMSLKEVESLLGPGTEVPLHPSVAKQKNYPKSATYVRWLRTDKDGYPEIVFLVAFDDGKVIGKGGLEGKPDKK